MRSPSLFPDWSTLYWVLLTKWYIWFLPPRSSPALSLMTHRKHSHLHVPTRTGVEWSPFTLTCKGSEDPQLSVPVLFEDTSSTISFTESSLWCLFIALIRLTGPGVLEQDLGLISLKITYWDTADSFWTFISITISCLDGTSILT